MAKDPVCAMTLDGKAAATRLQRKGVDEHEK
jgi:YHS domain-containing protein